MTRVRVWVNLGVFGALFAVLAWWGATNVVTIDALERPYRVTADFERTTGLQPNFDVTYLGVSQGRVGGVEARDDVVRVTFRLDRGSRIPSGVEARIQRKSAIGEPFVDLAPPPGYGGGGPYLAEGDHIPVERTGAPLEYAEVLRAARDLLAAVPPDRARVLVHELAAGLAGRTGDLRAGIDGLDRLTSSLAERTDALDRLATNSTRVVGVVADHRDAFGASFENLRLLAESLSRARGDLDGVLEHGPALAGAAGEVVAGVKPELDCMLRSFGVVLGAVADGGGIDDLGATLAGAPATRDVLLAVTDEREDGPWARVMLAINAANDQVPRYVPRKGPVAEPVVAGCSSALAPSGPASGSGADVDGPGGPGSQDGPGADGTDAAPAPIQGSRPGDDGAAGRWWIWLLAALGGLVVTAVLRPWRLLRRWWPSG